MSSGCVIFPRVEFDLNLVLSVSAPEDGAFGKTDKFLSFRYDGSNSVEIETAPLGAVFMSDFCTC